MGDAARKLYDDDDWEASAETRCAPRANVYLSVDIFSGHDYWTAVTLDMSEQGLFLATDNALPEVGSIVVLNINIPSENEPLVTLAEVRWTRARTGDNLPPGLGVQFVDLRGESFEKIARFVRSVREPLSFDA